MIWIFIFTLPSRNHGRYKPVHVFGGSVLVRDLQSPGLFIRLSSCIYRWLTGITKLETLLINFDPCFQDSGMVYTTHISYLEIYNEVGYDLLDPRHEASNLEDLPLVSPCVSLYTNTAQDNCCISGVFSLITKGYCGSFHPKGSTPDT